MSGPRRSTRVKTTEPEEEMPVAAKAAGKGKAAKKKVEEEEPAVEAEETPVAAKKTAKGKAAKKKAEEEEPDVEAEETPVAAKKAAKGKRAKKDQEEEAPPAATAEEEEDKPKAKKPRAAKAAEEEDEGESSEGLAVGSQAPTFSAKDETGEDISSGSLAGRYFCLFFYPKDNTPGCTKESCRFRDLNGEFEELNCSVFGVSADHAVSHGKFKTKFDLNFPLLVDTDRTLIKAFKAHRPGNKIQRSSVLVDPKGKVAAVWNPVKGAETHPNQVLAKLKDLTK